MTIIKIIILILLFSTDTVASVSPVSGHFSNFTTRATSKAFLFITKNDTLTTKINLVVTKNTTGQQFFLQCYQNGKLGFGEVTLLESPKSKTIVKAGQYCPFSEAEIEFDYDWVILNANGKKTFLIQGAINVPVTE